MAKQKEDITNGVVRNNDEMRIKSHLLAYDLLKTTAGWLENPDNEVFGLLEFDDESLSIAAKASVIASEVLKKAALDIQLITGIKDTNKYQKDIVDAMYEIKALADSFDSSGNEALIKKANVLDEILIIMASSVEEQKKLHEKFDKKIAEIKARSKKLNEDALVEKIAVEAKKPEPKKIARPLENSLKTRYCPKCTGGLLARLRVDVWYCMNCGQQSDFEDGFEKLNGTIVPGTSVSKQTSDNLDGVTITAIFGDKDNK